MSEAHAGNDRILEARDIRKSYKSNSKSVCVLSGANVEVQTGELLGIVGASGAGKSTLLHILGGLDRPDAGTILFRGTDILKQGDAYLERFRNRHVGFVFQFFNLLPDFTAVENAMFPGLIGGMDKKKARHRAEELLCQVGLKDRLNHKPGELSGGECQRVALARALMNQPDIVLADEPTGNLDSRASESLIQLIHELNQKHKQTFVIVTHSQKIARSLHRVLQLIDGKVTAIEKEIIL